jgi:hypothetical protein
MGTVVFGLPSPFLRDEVGQGTAAGKPPARRRAIHLRRFIGKVGLAKNGMFCTIGSSGRVGVRPQISLFSDEKHQ